MRVGVDLTGCDTPSEELEPVVWEIQKELREGEQLVVFAPPSLKISGSNIEHFPVSEVICMGDSPVLAVRRKKGSSLVQAVQMLKNGSLDAFVTAGNTGAFVVAATLGLSVMNPFQRPALIATLPTQKNPLVLLDVGAHLSFTPKRFLELCYMGAAYQYCRYGLGTSRIGLLNVGVEEKKGTLTHKRAYALIQDFCKSSPRMLFQGNVEARDVFSGDLDVVVTDGFAGNIFLKTAEGTARFIMDTLQERLMHTEKQQVLVEELKQVLNISVSPGALLCGPHHILIKCHGDVSAPSLLKGVQEALYLWRENFLQAFEAESMLFSNT